MLNLEKTFKKEIIDGQIVDFDKISDTELDKLIKKLEEQESVLKGKINAALNN